MVHVKCSNPEHHGDHTYYRVLDGREERAYCAGLRGSDCRDPQCSICNVRPIIKPKSRKGQE